MEKIQMAKEEMNKQLLSIDGLLGYRVSFDTIYKRYYPAKKHMGVFKKCFKNYIHQNAYKTPEEALLYCRCSLASFVEIV